MADVITKKPCPTCRSSGRDKTGDNQIVYSDGNTHCFSCNKTTFKNGKTKHIKKVKGMEMTGVGGAIRDRKISEGIVNKFNVTLEYNQNGSISKHHYPYFNGSGVIVGTKIRTGCSVSKHGVMVVNLSQSQRERLMLWLSVRCLTVNGL